MKRIENKTFAPSETVILDGHIFINCVFDGCDMVYHGQDNTAQIECRTGRPCNILIGGSAQRTIDVLQSLGFKVLSPFGEEPQETTIQ